MDYCCGGVCTSCWRTIGCIAFQAAWFHLSVEQFDAINFAGILFYKIAIVLFNIVPCIALYIVGRSKSCGE